MNKPLIAALSLAALLVSPLPSYAFPTPPGHVVLSTRVAQVSAADLTVVGPLKLGMSEAEVRDAVGAPKDGENQGVLVEATGAYSKVWHYPDQGLMLFLGGPTEQGPYKLEGVDLESPSTFTAAAGICVGMLETEAFNRFKTLVTEDINSYQTSDDQFGVLANSSYQGVVVDCANGVVLSVYVGPGPE